MMRLGAFVDRLCRDYDVTVLESLGGSLSEAFATRGPIQLRWLVRTDQRGKRHVASIPPRMNPDTMATDAVLRSLCNQLHIEPADFGLE